jgi:membrane protein DedA with SNARE-associated domain
MHGITQWLQQASGPAVIAVVAALVFCEDALFFGFVLPGETAVVLGGVVASQGHVSVYWLCVAVVLAAIIGDTVGYEVGARLGPRILDTRFLRPHRERIGSAQELIRRRGPVAVFLGRFIAFFRAMMPALAGISRMPYRVFLPFNAAGGLVWGVGFTLLGYFAGTAYKKVERTAGTAVAIAVAGVVVVALVVWEVRRRRRHAEQEEAGRREGDGGGADGGREDAGGADGGQRGERPEEAGGRQGADERKGAGGEDPGDDRAGPSGGGGEHAEGDDPGRAEGRNRR